MSLWYIERFLDNIPNIQSWLIAGKQLKGETQIERLVDRQDLRKGVF